jgi:hypothetical protein
MLIQKQAVTRLTNVVRIFNGEVIWGTAPQDGRFRVRFPVQSLEIFKRPIPSVHIHQPCVPLSFWQKWVPRNVLAGKVRPILTADNSAVPVVPNVKIRLEAQHSTPSKSSWIVTDKICLFNFIHLHEWTMLLQEPATEPILRKFSSVPNLQQRFLTCICLIARFFVWPWKSRAPHVILTSHRGHWPLLIRVSGIMWRGSKLLETLSFIRVT